MHHHYLKIQLFLLRTVLLAVIGTIVQFIASISTRLHKKLVTFTFESAVHTDLLLKFGRKRFSLTGSLHVSLDTGDITREREPRLLMSEGDPSQQNNPTTTSTTHEETPPSQPGSDHWRTAFESPQDNPQEEDQAVGGPDPIPDFGAQVLARLEEIRLRRLQRQRRSSTERIPEDGPSEQPQPPSEPRTPSPVDNEEHAIWLQTLDDLDRDDSYSDNSLPDGVRTHIRDNHSFGSH